MTEEEKILSDTDKAIKAALSAAKKKWGNGCVYTFEDDAIPERREAISTGALTLDNAIGIGGVPEGAFTEILGKSSVGKTTLALSICAQAQKKYPEKWIHYLDLEHSIDLEYLSNGIGVNLGKFALSQPDSGEEGYDIADKVLKSGGVSVLVIDSIAAIKTKEEIEKGPDENPGMAAAARLNSRELSRLKTIANQTGTAIILINQYRTGFGSGFSYQTVPGGIAQQYYASVIIDLEAEKLKAAEDAPEQLSVTAKITKNKVGSPYQIAKFDIYFGKGIVAESCTFAAAVKANIIEKSGSWYIFEGYKWHGKDSATSDMIKDQSLHERVKNLCCGNKSIVESFDPETGEVIDDMPLSIQINDDGTVTERKTYSVLAGEY
jgi:recombination protein RecA